MQNDQHQVLTPHGGIWIIELSKFTTTQINDEQKRWLTFFQQAEALSDNALPQWMQTKEMRQAMSTLKRFSDKDREYDKYQARQNFLREQSCIKQELEESAKREKLALQREESALQQKESAIKSENEAQANVKRLEAILAKQNISTDD